MEYFPAEHGEKGIRFDLSSPPAPLRRYIRSFAKIASYFDPVPASSSSSGPPRTEDGVRLRTWTRTDECVVMCLSNGTLQSKFFDDGERLMITNLHSPSDIAFRRIVKVTS